MLFSQISWVHSEPESSTAQDRALAFIETVLPIETAKFGVELKVDGNASEIPVELDTHGVSFGGEDEILIYFLGSKVGTLDYLDVILAVRNNTIYRGAVDLHTGPNVGQSSLNDATAIFLTRYQDYSGLDSTAMVEMLSNADLTHDTSKSSGNLTMITQHNPDGTTLLSWAYPNGSDYVVFDISFKNNFPVSFHDERQVQIIGYTYTPNPSLMPATTAVKDGWSDWSLAVAAIAVTGVLLAVVALVIKKTRRRHNAIKTQGT